MDSFESWNEFRKNESRVDAPLVCCECGKAAEGNVSCDDGEVCDACHARDEIESALAERDVLKAAAQACEAALVRAQARVAAADTNQEMAEAFAAYGSALEKASAAVLALAASFDVRG